MKIYDKNMKLLYKGDSMKEVADAVHNSIWGSSTQPPSGNDSLTQPMSIASKLRGGGDEEDYL